MTNTATTPTVASGLNSGWITVRTSPNVEPAPRSVAVEAAGAAGATGGAARGVAGATAAGPSLAPFSNEWTELLRRSSSAVPVVSDLTFSWMVSR